MKKKNVSTLKSEIYQKINDNDFETADVLARQLCEAQSLCPDNPMPEDFVFMLKQKERNEKMTNFKKYLAKAMAAVLIIGAAGGGVYAAVHSQGTTHTPYGIVTDGAASEDPESRSIAPDTPLPERENEIKVLSSEEGTGDTLWLSREIRQEISNGYASDDGVNWTEEAPSIADVTEYTYKNYADACKDRGLTERFNQTYDTADTVKVSEYTQHNETEDKTLNLTAGFNYKNGSFTLEESRDLNWDGTDTEVALITSTEPVTNQREYTSAAGYNFKLTDDNENGTTRTTTLLVCGDYHLVLSFFDLTDAEIFEILDSIK